MKDIKNTLERADINQANRDDNAGEGCKCNVFKGLHDWLSVFGFDRVIIAVLTYCVNTFFKQFQIIFHRDSSRNSANKCWSHSSVTGTTLILVMVIPDSNGFTNHYL